MRRISFILATALALIASPLAEAKLLYGVTTTTWEEGNARVVCVDTEALSPDSTSRTQFTEVSTIPGAADFMAGTWAKNKYYCYYNTYNQELDLSLQHFGILNMKTGEFTQIAEENHVGSDEVTDMMDMTYDPVGGGLLGLDRQYIPSVAFVGTIQTISMNTGKLREVCVLDKKYVAISSDSQGGFYLATLDRDTDGVDKIGFYKADNRFNVTPILFTGDKEGESSFAHSMALDEEKLYLATGSVLTVLDLVSLEATSYYMEKDFYGITFDIAQEDGVRSVYSSDDEREEYYNLQGISLSGPTKGEPVICRKGNHVMKILK